MSIVTALVVLTVILALAAGVFTQSVRYRQARAAAQHDELTGILNRRGLEEHLAGLRGRDGAIAVIDLDYFKQVNDRLGHPGGDQVLNRVARTLASLTPAGGVLARYGGEEFVLVTPLGVDAVRVAESIRARVQNIVWPDVTVTVSIGVGRGVIADELMADADRALYAAKRAGRNAVAYVDTAGLTVVAGRAGLRRSVEAEQAAGCGHCGHARAEKTLVA